MVFNLLYKNRINIYITSDPFYHHQTGIVLSYIPDENIKSIKTAKYKTGKIQGEIFGISICVFYEALQKPFKSIKLF